MGKKRSPTDRPASEGLGSRCTLLRQVFESSICPFGCGFTKVSFALEVAETEKEAKTVDEGVQLTWF